MYKSKVAFLGADVRSTRCINIEFWLDERLRKRGLTTDEMLI